MFLANYIKNAWMPVMRVQMNAQNTTIRIVRNVQKLAASVQKLVIKLFKQI
jgi:hypothetical protein